MADNENFISRLISRIFPPHAPAAQVEATLLESPTLPPAVALARNWDGRVRERAMPELAKLDAHTAIPELLIRINDWVPQVRLAARQALRSMMTDQHAPVFAEQLPSIAHLSHQQRDQHAVLIDEVHAYLLLPQNAKHLINAVSASKPRVARIASRLCMEHALIPEQELLARCLASADVLTRLTALPLLHRGCFSERTPLLALALSNSCMQLRREAFLVYCKEQPAAGTDIAQALLFDRSTALREMALNMLVKRGVSVQAVLLPILDQRSAQPERLKHAIWGLAELGDATLLPRLSELLLHTNATVRRAATLALVKLDRTNTKARLLGGLRDESATVYLACASQLVRSKMEFNLDDLLALLREDALHLRKIALRLAPQAGKWDWVILLLEAANVLQATPEQHVVAEALTQWNLNFNRSLSQPTAQQVHHIRHLLARCGTKISRLQRELIEFSLPSLQR